MAGILFLRTPRRPALKDFYTGTVGMTTWLEQAECTLLQHGNLLLGLCDGPEEETGGLVTFLYPHREDVDAMYERLRDRALKPPAVNERYRIYHFYARDPADRALEFQAFLHPVAPYMDGRTLLVSRRSVRRFLPDPVPDALLESVLEACRWSPTSMHSQSYDFVVTRNRAVLEALAALRGGSSAPLARAPMGVAVCGDPAKSGAAGTDATIAAVQFLLSAWDHGLGTVWIGAMDRPAVKELLGIPEEHVVATVTPLGFPAERAVPRDRRPVRDLYRIVP